MVQPTPGAGPTGPTGADAAAGRRLSGGAIASLVGVALLVIFMIQNTEGWL